MKLKTKEIIAINNGLAALNGKQKAVKNDEGKELIVVEAYNFDSKVKWNIAKNKRIMTKEVETFNELRDDIIKRLANGNREIDPSDKKTINMFFEELEKLEKTEVEVDGLLKFKLADLKIEENNLSPAILESLFLLIEE